MVRRTSFDLVGMTGLATMIGLALLPSVAGAACWCGGTNCRCQATLVCGVAADGMAPTCTGGGIYDKTDCHATTCYCGTYCPSSPPCQGSVYPCHCFSDSYHCSCTARCTANHLPGKPPFCNAAVPNGVTPQDPCQQTTQCSLAQGQCDNGGYLCHYEQCCARVAPSSDLRCVRQASCKCGRFNCNNCWGSSGCDCPY